MRQVIINSTWQNENGFGNWRLDNGAHLTRFMGRSNVFDISFSLTDGLQSYIYADFIQGQGPQSKLLTEDDKAAIQNATDAYFRILEERYPWLEDAATFPEVRTRVHAWPWLAPSGAVQSGRIRQTCIMRPRLTAMHGDRHR